MVSGGSDGKGRADGIIYIFYIRSTKKKYDTIFVVVVYRIL